MCDLVSWFSWSTLHTTLLTEYLQVYVCIFCYSCLQFFCTRISYTPFYYTYPIYRNIDVYILLQMQHATHYTRKHTVYAHHPKFTISQRLLTHYQHLRIQIYLKTFLLKILQ